MSLQLHRRDAALSGRVFTVGHCSIPPHSEAVLHCITRTVGGRSLPPSGLLEGRTVFSENTGLVVGRTLVDTSGWKVPVLVSNFGQETVMVEPFSGIGMIAQVSAIQPTMNRRRHPSCDPVILPEHLQGLLKRTSGDLDSECTEEPTGQYIVGIRRPFLHTGLCLVRTHGRCGTHHRYR